MQVLRDSFEIKKHIHLKVALDRDTGETFLSLIYNELINSDCFYIHSQDSFLQPNRIPDNTVPGMQLALKVLYIK